MYLIAICLCVVFFPVIIWAFMTAITAITLLGLYLIPYIIGLSLIVLALMIVKHYITKELEKRNNDKQAKEQAIKEEQEAQQKALKKKQEEEYRKLYFNIQ